MSLDTYFILEEFEQKINSEFQEFLKTFDAEHASLYPTPKMSSDLSKGDFSVMLKGVASKLYEVPASELEGLSAKDQKNKKAQLQNQFADTFSANITARLSDFANEKKGLIQRAESVGGFLNIFVTRGLVFAAGVHAITERLGTEFGRCNLKNGQKVIIEHTSSNPNGPLHIGNLRNVILGGHLAELFKCVGYDVHQHFFVNDLGAQIGLTALGYNRIFDKLAPKLKIDQWIGFIYAIMNTLNEIQKTGVELSECWEAVLSRKSVEAFLKLTDEQRAAIDPKILEKRDEFLATFDDLHSRQPELCEALLRECQHSNIKKEAGELNLAYERNEPEAVAIFRNMVNNCLSGVQKTLDTYNIKHDQFDYESELGWEGSNDRVMKIMKASPYFVPATMSNDKGVPEGGHLLLKDFIADRGYKTGKGGYQADYPNFYILRPDGSTLYTFRDVVYSLKKVGNADLVFNIIASEQNLPQQKVQLSMQLVDPKAPPKQYHVSYELVNLFRAGKVVKMSGRRGRYELADDLYDELKDTVIDLMVKKYQLKAEQGQGKALEIDNPEDRKFLQETGAEVATASMKFTLLATGPRHPITFDIVKAADPTESSSGSYLLYNCTRFSSLIRKFEDGVKEGKWGALPPVEQINFARLDSQEEWAMFLKFAMAFPAVVYDTACPRIPELPQLPEFATNRLCDHLMALAHEFSRYYGKFKILSADDQELMFARIHWARALKQVMENGLRILTIVPVQKM